MVPDIQQVSWPGWETTRVLGRGSFGAVYEIQRDMLGDVEKAALKVISIPQSSSEIEELYNDGYDEESIISTYQSHLKSIINEYSMMRKLNDCSNIVHCDDVRYEKKTEGIGWNIYIKMELLTPLAHAMPESPSEDMVLKVAMDMCTALELCEKHNIIHRDIKPQNMFMSPNGNCKLGDFGVAKTVERTMGGTKIGTFKYMAPEVYNNQPYGTGADIYSLGLVLYWMLNQRRMPFMPLPPAKLLAGMDGDAANKRLSGVPIPPPQKGSAELKRIVLKACAFHPKDRYQSAAEMLRDLDALQRQPTPAPIPTPIPQPAPVVADIDETVRVRKVADATPPKAPAPTPMASRPAFNYEVETVRVNRPVTSENKPVVSSQPFTVTQTQPLSSHGPRLPQPKPPRRRKKLRIALILLTLLIGIPLLVFLIPQMGPNIVDKGMVISAGFQYTIAVKENGTVVATGDMASKVSPWLNIVSVDSGYNHVVGLTSKGTVKAAGSNLDGQTNTASWTDIVAISAGDSHTVGLKSDGTVVATGSNSSGQCDVSGWTDITAISAGDYFTLGLKKDGTVVVAGSVLDKNIITAWRGIIAISADSDAFALTADGTVLTDGSCNVSDWKDIVAISAGKYHIVGLRSDSTVVSASRSSFTFSGLTNSELYDVDSWKDIVAISAGYNYTVGLKADGTVVAVGNNAYGQCDVSDWKKIRSNVESIAH